MKKRILVFVTTLALLLMTAMPVLATQSWYGRYGEAGDTAELQEVSSLANKIYDTYGVDAIYIVDDEATGEDSAKNYLEASLTELAPEDDYIVYSCTADDCYMRWEGDALSSFDSDLATSLFNDCEPYEQAGDYDQAATVFLNSVLTILGGADADENGNGDVETPGALIAPNPNADSLDYVHDEAGILNDDERIKLNDKLAEISERQQFGVYVITVDSIGSKEPKLYAADYYEAQGFGYGADTDGVLLMLAMESRDWAIVTHGSGIPTFTDRGQQWITDNILPDLSDGNYYDAFSAYAGYADDFITQAKNGEPYDVNNLPKKKKTIGAVLKGVVISLAVGLIAGFIAMKKVKGDYEKAVRFKANASDYLVNGSLQLTGSYDNFMYSNVTSRKIERQSSSGGGSSTFHSSSGGSFGGSSGKF